MPGICGGIHSHNPKRLPDLLPEMLRAMPRLAVCREEFACDETAGLALGRVSLGFVNSAPQPAQAADGRFLAVMDGELHDVEALRSQLQSRGARLAGVSHAELLAVGLAAEGRDFLRRLHGSFAAAIWDSHTRQLHLVNDRFGTRPLYVTQNDGELLFASSIQAILAHPEVSREINPAGLAQFFTFGHYLREDTSLAAIRVLPGAAWMTWDDHAKQLTVERYWRENEALADPPADRAAWLEQIDAALQRAVARRVENTPALGIALSGGLDARTVLGLIDVQRTPLQSLCLGMKGSLDHRAAARLAAIAGCPHHNHELGAGFLENFAQHLDAMVRLTDGQYLSQCIAMPTLPIYQQLGVQVLLRGHAGELMHMTKAYNYSLDRDAVAIRSDAQLRQWLFRRLQAYMLDGVEKPVFAPQYQNHMAELARRSIDQDVADTQGAGEPLQQIWRLFIAQRLRRETVLSLVKFRSVVEPRLPFLDNDLVDLLFAAPPSLKLAEDIQSYILRKHRPEFLSVVNANTGAKLGASELARRAAHLRLRVLAKLGAPGYQPYERLGLWLRRELAPLVKKVLLSDQCLERGVFDAAGVRAVVDQHLHRGRNHTYLLLAMMIFEQGQRCLFGETSHDSDSGGASPALLSTARGI
jgi:asparagine synthase (glutamine-hydrolysing)